MSHPNTINTSALFKHLAQRVVGFDEIFSTFEKLTNSEVNASSVFPPRNVIRFNNNHFQLQYAVAGFSENELSVVIERDNILVISGVKNECPELETDPSIFLHRGIALRDFRNEITIPDGATVDVELEKTGLLIVNVKKPERKEPEPKLIPIVRS